MAEEFDFVVQMSEAPGGYEIEVSSSAGEDREVVSLRTDDLLSRMPDLQAAILGSSVHSRGAGSELEEPVLQIGNALFDSVFRDSIKGLYISSKQKAEEQDHVLRIVLRVRSPELAALPWELLHDSKVGGYLCLDHPIVRYVDILKPVAPLRVSPPLRVLGMIALPGSLSSLDTETEKENLHAALKPLIDEGMVRLEWVPGNTKSDLYSALLRGGCHVLHFIGHGRFDEHRRQGAIIFVDERGREDPLHAGALGSLISVGQPRPRLVVLNSCQTGTSNAQDLFSSTAAQLEHTVPAVVAMQFAVTDTAAVLFSRAFYQALAANRPVDEAVRTGRIALRVHKDDSLECFTPVLYQRAGDARLFDLTARTPPPPPAPETTEPPPERGKHGVDTGSETEPDSRRAETGSGPVKAADLPVLPVIDTDHWVVSMAVHPRGRLVATGARRLVRLWDATTGQAEWERRIPGWSTMANAVCFSPDGGLLAVGSSDNSARVWDLATGQVSLEFAHRHFVNAVDFDAGTRRLATGDSDSLACLWDLRTGSKILTLRHGRAVRDVSFSPDGTLLLTASEDRHAYVWDTATGEQRARIPHESYVLGAAFSPDGRRIATCSEDRTAQIRDTRTWEPLFHIEHRSGLRAVAFSPDSALIATGSEDGAVHVWSATTGEQVLHIKHKRSVNVVAFYPDGRHLASGGEDKNVRSTRISTQGAG
ncbi:CHAT domain-containing protein [Streptomyces sp. NPDC005402]|uniref:CHAT domain-containing WD40 repeat protein n=1 Tax=Streptomyces sp. NPDC005402 TaxID=3155338 RepID=UPI0033B23377